MLDITLQKAVEYCGTFAEHIIQCVDWVKIKDSSAPKHWISFGIYNGKPVIRTKNNIVISSECVNFDYEKTRRI